MSSEIKVDTISENTSANGVSIDGVKLKDNILTVQGTSTTGGTIEIENTDTGGAANDYFGKLIFKGNDSSSSASGTRASVEGKVTGNFGSSQIDFLTASGGASAARIATISPDGLSLADGNITFEGSGHGIHLGVTSATASNLLDDYEEGTWTPANGQVSLSVQSGIYVKVGELVFVQAYYNMPSTSDTTGHQVTGLPFTVKAEGFSFCATRVGGESSQIVVQLNGAATTGDFYKSDDTAPTNANLSGDYVLFSGCYRTA